MSDLQRPDDVEFDRDQYVALGFLASYREPTRSLYALNLRQWFAWCQQRGIKPLSAERAHIEVWAREMEERQGLKASTVANKLNTVSGFYRVARRDKHVVDDPAEYIRRPSVPRVTTTKSLTRSELLKCLDIAQGMHHQDHALWCILGLNGLRIGEACALDVENLGRQGGYRTLRVEREKGNRSGDIPLSPRTSWALDNMLGTRTAGPLFRQRWGERLDRKGANRIVQRVVKAGGITNKRITPHSLRHTFITMALDAGVAVRDVQNSLGYSDSRMVAYYDHGKESLSRNATHFVSAYVEGS